MERSGAGWKCLYWAMSRLPGSALTLVLTGLLTFLPAATAGAAGTPAPSWPPGLCMPPGLTGFQRLPDQYYTCGDCHEDGDAGLSRGDWQEYYCVTWPVGLDVVHYLYVR